jgi:hypothetical protein
MSATLTVKRETKNLIELRRGPFQITLDGTTVATIDRHGSFESSIEAGHHNIQVSDGRYRSRAKSFDIAYGETAYFRCNGARIWPVYLISFAVPSLALTLRRD